MNSAIIELDAPARNQTLEYVGEVDINKIKPYPGNTKQHDKAQIQKIMASIMQFGFVDPLVVDARDWVVVGGHGRLEAATQLRMTKVPVVKIYGLTDEKRAALSISLNALTLSTGFDLDKLREEVLKLEAANFNLAFTGIDQEDLSVLLADDFDPNVLADEVGEADNAAIMSAEEFADKLDEETGRKWVEMQGVDALFPSDNELGIPTLSLDGQADYVDLPVIIYGSVGRNKLAGTISFYSNDWRFDSVWADPRPVAAAASTTIIEPNFSVVDQFPMAWAIWQTYRKRWLARYWQTKGKRIIVDVFTGNRYADLNLVGVPKGWKAYATSGRGTVEDLMGHYRRCCEHAESQNILFVVQGGPSEVEQLCRKYNWTYVLEHMNKASAETKGKETVKRKARKAKKRAA